MVIASEGKLRQNSFAYGYMRTSSSANVGADKDSEKRQPAAIEGYAKLRSPLMARAPSLSRALTGSPATSPCSSPVTIISSASA